MERTTDSATKKGLTAVACGVHWTDTHALVKLPLSQMELPVEADSGALKENVLTMDVLI